MHLCRNDDLARELTQETFYQAIKCIERFDGRSSVYTWLCSIARHTLYDSLQKQKSVETLSETLPDHENFLERLFRKEQALAAHQLLHALDEPYREVFILRTFCDLSHAQIAHLFSKSEAWSRVTYYRARQMLQSAMKENEYEKE